MRAPLLLPGLLVWALFGAAPAPVARADEARPRIAFDKKDDNFGQVVVGTPVERVFRFSNKGTAPLHVRRVKPSCGCTAALLSKSELQPGEVGEIRLRFDSSERLGYTQVSVEVFTDDDQEREGELTNTSTLHLSGEVVSLLNVLPPAFYFPQLQRGAPAGMAVTVLPTDVAAVSATAAACSNPALRARLAPYERSGRRGFEVGLDVPADVALGRLEGIVTITTDHPKQPVLQVRVLGQVNGRLITFPNRIQLFPQEGGEKETSISILRIAGEGPIGIESIETPSFLEARIEEILPGKRSEVPVRLKPGTPAGPIAGTVRIFLRDAEQPMVEVSVVGEVARRVTIDPPAIWMAGRAGEGAGAPPITLKVLGGKVLSVRVEPADEPSVVAAVEATDRVKVTLAPLHKTGAMRGRILLTTDVPGEETIEVPVHGIVSAAAK